MTGMSFCVMTRGLSVRTEPEGFDKWNPSMRGVFKKGHTAFLEGQGLEDCPYKDKRNDAGRITWSRAYIGAWRDGWFWAQQGN
jgi:hypothetical protein